MKASTEVSAGHYEFMRDALLYALAQLLAEHFTEEVAAAWSETYDMLADAMQKHARGKPDAEAFARAFGGKFAGPLTEPKPAKKWFDAGDGPGS